MQETQARSLVRELRSHMPWSSSAHVPQLESPCAARLKEDPARHSQDLTQPSKCCIFFFFFFAFEKLTFDHECLLSFSHLLILSTGVRLSSFEDLNAHSLSLALGNTLEFVTFGSAFPRFTSVPHPVLWSCHTRMCCFPLL